MATNTNPFLVNTSYFNATIKAKINMIGIHEYDDHGLFFPEAYPTKEGFIMDFSIWLELQRGGKWSTRSVPKMREVL